MPPSSAPRSTIRSGNGLSQPACFHSSSRRCTRCHPSRGTWRAWRRPLRLYSALQVLHCGIQLKRLQACDITECFPNVSLRYIPNKILHCLLAEHCLYPGTRRDFNPPKLTVGTAFSTSKSLRNQRYKFCTRARPCDVVRAAIPEPQAPDRRPLQQPRSVPAWRGALQRRGPKHKNV